MVNARNRCGRTFHFTTGKSRDQGVATEALLQNPFVGVAGFDDCVEQIR